MRSRINSSIKSFIRCVCVSGLEHKTIECWGNLATIWIFFFVHFSGSTHIANSACELDSSQQWIPSEKPSDCKVKILDISFMVHVLVSTFFDITSKTIQYISKASVSNQWVKTFPLLVPLLDDYYTINFTSILVSSCNTLVTQIGPTSRHATH